MTFGEALMRWSVRLSALLMTAAAVLVGQISIQIERLVVINLGLTAISLFGIIIAIFIGIGLVSKEIEKRTLYTVLSRPVRRWEFVAGKFLGLAGTLVINTFFMALGFFAGLLYLTHHFQRADAYLLAIPLYNFGIPQHVKAWIDLAFTDPRLSSAVPTPLAGRPAALVLVRGGGYGPGCVWGPLQRSKTTGSSDSDWPRLPRLAPTLAVIRCQPTKPSRTTGVANPSVLIGCSRGGRPFTRRSGPALSRWASWRIRLTIRKTFLTWITRPKAWPSSSPTN